MAEGQLLLKIITPERIFYEHEATMVEFNTTEGEIGIYPRHVPTTVVIAPGILTISEAEGKREAALLAGFAQILPTGVTILTEDVEWPDEIDVERARSAKVRAEERLRHKSADVDVLRAETALHRAITRINVIH